MLFADHVDCEHGLGALTCCRNLPRHLLPSNRHHRPARVDCPAYFLALSSCWTRTPCSGCDCATRITRSTHACLAQRQMPEATRYSLSSWVLLGLGRLHFAVFPSSSKASISSCTETTSTWWPQVLASFAVANFSLDELHHYAAIDTLALDLPAVQSPLCTRTRCTLRLSRS